MEMHHTQAPEYFGRDLEAMWFARNYYAWVFDEFRPFLGKNVGEVGAGSGTFADFVLKAGVSTLVAFEPSANMFPLLQQRLSRCHAALAVQGFLETHARAYREAFDSILYVNVLEHVEYDAQELSIARTTLQPNGYLLALVPAQPWLYSDFDRHVGHFRRYTKRGLRKLVECNGFSIVELKHFDVAGIIPWYVAYVLLKRTLTSGNVSAYDSIIVPVMRRIEQLVPPPIGKSLILIARKI